MRVLPAAGLAALLMLQGCGAAPPVTTRTGTCAGASWSTIAASGLTPGTVTQYGGGLVSPDGSCTFLSGRPADPQSLSISRTTQSVVAGDIQTVTDLFQTGSVVQGVGSMAVWFNEGPQSALYACQTACLQLRVAGFSLPLAKEESTMRALLASVDQKLPPSPTPQPTPQSPTLPSACSLLSTSEISQATGWYLTQEPSADPDTCSYSSSDGTFNVSVAVSSTTPAAFAAAAASAPGRFQPGTSLSTSYGTVQTIDQVDVTSGYVRSGTVEVTITITADYTDTYAIDNLVPLLPSAF